MTDHEPGSRDDDAENAAPFSEQRKPAVESGELNTKVDVVELLNDGGAAVTRVVGGVRSTVQLRDTGADVPVVTSLT